MISKKMIMTSLMVLLLTSCAHEEYHVGPVIGIKLDGVKKALTNNTPKFRKCFDESKAPAENQGSTMLNFTVNEKGEVSKSEIETNQAQTDQAIECMKNVLSGIKFPAPINATSYDVKQSMNF